MDNTFRIDRNTEPEEIREFVADRVRDPIEVDGVTVWNFSTHDVEMDALREVASSLHRDHYVIPYQVPGAWAYMVRVMPNPLSDAELLVYSKREERYKAFPNFRRLASEFDDHLARKEPTKWLLNNTDIAES